MRFATRFAAAAALLVTSAAPMAHEVHGLGGSHWHATDTAGFAVLALAAALAIWLARGE
jgi:hypothetical protein